MAVTAIFTNKGGVGKTTLACNLAHEMATAGKGRRTLLIDADPQCNASILMLGARNVINRPARITTMADVMRPVMHGDGYIKNIRPVPATRFKTDVLIGSPELALSEDLLAADWSSAKSGDMRGINTSRTLLNLVDRLREDYDEIIIDCGPTLGSINRAALIAADQFIAPVSQDVFGLAALDNMSRWIGHWNPGWRRGIAFAHDQGHDDLGADAQAIAKFAGYVTMNIPYLRAEERADITPFDVAAQKLFVITGGAPLGGDEPRIADIGYAAGTPAMARHVLAPVSTLTHEDGLVGAAFSHAHKFGQHCARLAENVIGPDKLWPDDLAPDA